MTPRLVGQHPDVFDRDCDGAGGTEVVFHAASVRFIHARRARRLRRRGEFVMSVGAREGGKTRFAWFVAGSAPLVLWVPA